MQWPAFVLFTSLDGVVLDALPPISTTGLNLIEGVLIATFGNLVLIGAAAPFLARRLDRRRQAVAAAPALGRPAEVEREVLQDRVATALLAAGLAASLASGLANRHVIVSETEATQEAARAIDRFVAHSGNAELQRNNDTANTRRLADGYFRICIARDDRRRYFCYFVDTRRKPAKIVRDPSAEPNSISP